MSRGIRLSVRDLTLRTRTVEIPRTCPKCKAKLIGNNTLREISRTPSSMFVSVGKSGELYEHCQYTTHEGDFIVEYHCANCDEILLSGEEEDLDRLAHGPVDNALRAEWASKAVATYALQTGIQKEDLALQLGDLLCDLQHLADSNEINWPHLVAKAKANHNEEVEEESA